MVLDGERLLAVVAEQIVAGMRGGKTRAQSTPAMVSAGPGGTAHDTAGSARPVHPGGAPAIAAAGYGGAEAEADDPQGPSSAELPGGGR
jgi:hypothetical protein